MQGLFLVRTSEFFQRLSKSYEYEGQELFGVFKNIKVRVFPNRGNILLPVDNVHEKVIQWKKGNSLQIIFTFSLNCFLEIAKLSSTLITKKK